MSENSKSAIQKFTEFINKYLPEKEKADLKTLAAEFAEEKPAEEAAPSYNEIPLQDGSVLKVAGEMGPGAECLLVTPEGEVPAPEGEHTAADGSIIVVKKEGEKSVIAEVKPAAEMADQKMQAAIDELKKHIDGVIASKFSTVDSENKKLKSELESTKLKLAKVTSQLGQTVGIVNAFANIPTDEPIIEPQKPVSKTQELNNKKDNLVNRIHKQ